MHVRDKHKRRIGRRMEVRVRTLDVGTVAGGGGLAGVVVGRRVGELCVLGTRWKGSGARDVGDGGKVFCHGGDGSRGGVRVVLREEYVGRVLGVGGGSGGVVCVRGLMRKVRW